MLVPIIPFVAIGELPGERWLLASEGEALRFGGTGAALLAADLLLPIPSSVVGTLLGARLGATVGFLCAFVGLSASALIGYAAGRLVPARFVAELPRTPTALVIFVSRPVPVLAEAAALTAGAGRTPLGSFLSASTAGNALYAGALALAGSRGAAEGWAGPALAIPMLLPVVTYLAWRRLARRRT